MSKIQCILSFTLAWLNLYGNVSFPFHGQIPPPQTYMTPTKAKFDLTTFYIYLPNNKSNCLSFWSYDLE